MGYTSIAGMPVVTGLYKMLVPKRCSRWSLASLAALVTAGLLLLARLIGLAFLADFLSRAVLIGFLTGVGIQVAAAQLAGMLGVCPVAERERSTRC